MKPSDRRFTKNIRKTKDMKNKARFMEIHERANPLNNYFLFAEEKNELSPKLHLSPILSPDRLKDHPKCLSDKNIISPRTVSVKERKSLVVRNSKKKTTITPLPLFFVYEEKKAEVRYKEEKSLSRIENEELIIL